MKGRKPKLRIIDGGHAPGRCPVAPSWLAPHAKAGWKRAAPELHARGLLAPDTLASLEAYCVATGTIRECEDIMAREGRLVTNEGVAKPHQAFKMQNAAMREARLLAAELGLTPHRRVAGGKDPKEKAEGWDADLLA